MTLHKLSAGNGYTYLTRQVAANDVTATGYASLGEYYSERGEAPGQWLGGGLVTLDQGPAAGDWAQEAIEIIDMSADGAARWPIFARAAQLLGVQSMLCLPLQIDARRLGTLSLYSEKPDAFSSSDRLITGLYATFAAIALSEAQRTEGLLRGLRNRDVLGQAKGILMERLRITADEAWDVLNKASQAANVKLVVLAEELAATGELRQPAP